MRITGCHIKAFGRFQDERFEGLDHPAVVMLGDNETGKTTLRHFIETMLYGIAPEEPGAHPYAPREGGRSLEGSMAYRRGDGSAEGVTRRMATQPQAQLVNGSEEMLHNRHVPAVQHVPRSVFEVAYSLDVSSLARGLSEEALSVLRRRLFYAFDAPANRPAREVATELRREADALWHPSDAAATDPDGHDPERRLDELSEETAEAQASEQRARRLYRDVRELEEQIDEAWQEQEDLRARKQRLERLAPVRKRLRQIEELRERVGDTERHEMLPEEPQKALRRREQHIEDHREALEEQRRRIRELERDAERVTEQDRRTLKREADIETWKNKRESHERRAERLQKARQEKREARRRLEDAAQRLLSEPWHGDLADTVRQLSMGEVRRLMRDYERAVSDLQEEETRAGALSERADVRRALWPWLALAAVGAAMAGSVQAEVPPVIPYAAPLGVALAAAGALQAVANGWHNRRLKRAPASSLSLEERRTAVEEQAALVIEQLSKLPIPEERLQQLDRDLLDDLRTLFEALRLHDERAERVQEDARLQLQENQAVEAVASACGVQADSHELSRTVARLSKRLEEARRHREAAREAEEQLPARREEAEQHSRRLDEFERERDAWVGVLKEMGDDDLETGCRVLNSQREAARRLRLVEDQLYQEFPDWKAHRAEIRKLEQAEGWTRAGAFDEEASRLQARIEAATDRTDQLRTERDEKREQLAQAEQAVSSAELQSEHADAKALLAERRRRRDQLLFLSNLVEEGHRRFRARHQPGVLDTTGDFARRITEGGCEHVTLDNETWSLRVTTESGKEQPVAAPPLSRGTYDQVQLAFRLAVAHHLDGKRERLPFLLDEVFVNWDTTRRRAAFDVLSDIASERQIFVFTCHPYFAREAADFLNGKMVRLSGL
jgi:uncharacterized protein YhaN